MQAVKTTRIDYCDHGVDPDTSENSTAYILLQGPQWMNWKTWMIEGSSSSPCKCSSAHEHDPATPSQINQLSVWLCTVVEENGKWRIRRSFSLENKGFPCC